MMAELLLGEHNTCGFAYPHANLASKTPYFFSLILTSDWFVMKLAYKLTENHPWIEVTESNGIYFTQK